MEKIFRKKLTKKGFTLAELLIVVAIIAVLIAIAAPLFIGALKDAQDAVGNANLRAVKGIATAEILSNWSTYGKAGSGTAKAWKVEATVDAKGDVSALTIKAQESGTANAGTATRKDDGSYEITGMILTELAVTEDTSPGVGG